MSECQMSPYSDLRLVIRPPRCMLGMLTLTLMAGFMISLCLILACDGQDNIHVGMLTAGNTYSFPLTRMMKVLCAPNQNASWERSFMNTVSSYDCRSTVTFFFVLPVTFALSLQPCSCRWWTTEEVARRPRKALPNTPRTPTNPGKCSRCPPRPTACRRASKSTTRTHSGSDAMRKNLCVLMCFLSSVLRSIRSCRKSWNRPVTWRLTDRYASAHLFVDYGDVGNVSNPVCVYYPALPGWSDGSDQWGWDRQWNVWTGV